MRSKHGRIALAIVTATIFAAPIAIAYAYSIYPGATGGNGVSQPVQSPPPGGATTSFDFGSAWGQLSAPFEGFLNNLGNITPSDLPSQVINPSKQIQSMIPQNFSSKDVVMMILNFLALITGWLIGLSTQLANWVISLIK